MMIKDVRGRRKRRKRTRTVSRARERESVIAFQSHLLKPGPSRAGKSNFLHMTPPFPQPWYNDPRASRNPPAVPWHLRYFNLLTNGSREETSAPGPLSDPRVIYGWNNFFPGFVCVEIIIDEMCNFFNDFDCDSVTQRDPTSLETNSKFRRHA
ncbi:hypothetical protein LSTR_LSTR006340 [Laodelphax striatellus]|uniref:Uncharacterized protein n=1 Tax=Laodelphax striatellus TaxID=195883 RepID=A0A482XEE0_LAOST|nr:hypothetical protein LSTR_LSTR006340 [Laodelphax striatellus]